MAGKTTTIPGYFVIKWSEVKELRRRFSNLKKHAGNEKKRVIYLNDLTHQLTTELMTKSMENIRLKKAIKELTLQNKILSEKQKQKDNRMVLSALQKLKDQ